MSDKSIEKAFLYFLILSFVLHVAALTCFIIIFKQKENRTQHADAVKPLERIPGKPVPLRVPTIGRGPLPGGSTIQPPKGKTLPELSKLYPNSNQMKGFENRYRKELG